MGSRWMMAKVMRGAMKVAVIHSFYGAGSPSGENTAVQDQVAALERAGHRVELFASETDVLSEQRTYKLRTLTRLMTGRGASPGKPLEDFAPDVIHVHNLFPNLTSDWLADCHAPWVMTLHNYRLFCCARTFYRDGATCRLCLDDRWAGVRHSCYRDSTVASLAATLSSQRLQELALRSDGHFIVLNPLMRKLLLGMGVGGERVHQIPNFLPAEWGEQESKSGPRGGWLYVGRFAQEKGVGELLEAWPPEQPLRVVGVREEDGRSLEGVSVPPEVDFAGRLTREAVALEMYQATGLVVPSRWNEGLPLVYIEALACGLPVVAYSGSEVARLVVEQGTGATYADARSLRTALTYVMEHRADLSRNARAVFSARYSEDQFVQRVTALYRTLVA